MTTPAPARRRSFIALLVFMLVSFAVSALAGLATSTSVGSWYQTLAKPAFSPPDRVFGPVWTLLYVLIAVAGWRVWRLPASGLRRFALCAWAAQMALNLLWSFLFFGARAIGPALAEIAALLGAIALTLWLFWRLDRPAGLMFLPYLLWVGFATALNAALWVLN